MVVVVVVVVMVIRSWGFELRWFVCLDVCFGKIGLDESVSDQSNCLMGAVVL
jgi:hypothetical protein